MRIKCHVCGCENVAGDEFCAECGIKLEGLASSVAEDELGLPGADAAAPTAPPPAGAAPEGALAGGDLCPSCGRSVPLGAKFCKKCGARIKGVSPAELVVTTCPVCRAEVETDDAFCNACGARLGGALEIVKPETSEVGPDSPVVFRLVVVTGHDKDRVFELRGEQARIGRLPENEVVLDTDGYVSGRHTRIFRDGDKFFVEDLGSTNGTFMRVKERVALQPGDEVKVGQSIFRFES